MEELLNDRSKFERLTVEEGKDYNYLWNQELRVRKTLQRMKQAGSISKELYVKLCPSGSRPGVMYGLAKVHKDPVDGFPKLRPILSAIGTPTYKLAKHLVQILEPLTKDDFTVKDSFTVTNNIQTVSADGYMTSFDIDSLFTNIPLDETIDICCDKLFANCDSVQNLSKSQFREMLELATKDSFIAFNGNYYQQVDGVAMGSPLGPTLANVFLCHHEESWLNQCSSDIRPVCFLRYVDDIFVLFRSGHQVNDFHNYINSQHPNMRFTIERESEDCLPFLDVHVRRVNSVFVTSVFRKPTFSGVFTNYGSFIPELYKRNLVSTLLFRSFTLCSDWVSIHNEILVIKDTLKRNAFPESLLNDMVKSFLNKVLGGPITPEISTKEKFDIILPFLGNISGRTKKRITRLFQNYLPQCKINFVFRSKTRLSSLLSFKDKLPFLLNAGIIYKYTCSRCNSTYVGKTKRHIKKRYCEHQGRSPLTGKLVKGQLSTTVRDHTLDCDTVVEFSDFSILGRDSRNDFLKIKESLFIRKEKPNLNIQGQSIPLTLFL